MQKSPTSDTYSTLYEQESLLCINLCMLQANLEDCYIAGNVDFVWGEGAVYFNRCEIKTVGRSGVIVQARNGTGYGYVFVDSKISSDAGITGSALVNS